MASPGSPGTPSTSNTPPRCSIAQPTVPRAIAERLGDKRLNANAEYEIGFRYVVERHLPGLREHEQRALALYEELGDVNAAAQARQALVLGSFLGGDREAARELETAGLEAFRRSGSWYRVADSHTLLSAIEY